MGFKWKRIILILLDAIWIIVAGYGALLLRFNGPIPEKYFYHLSVMLLPMIICGIFIFYYFKMYLSLWQFASIAELKNILYATSISSLANVCILEIFNNGLPRSCYFIYFLLITMFLGGSRLIYRLIQLRKEYSGFNNIKLKQELEKVMIIGAGLAGEKIYREIINSKAVYKEVMCFIDDDCSKHNRTVHGVKIYGSREKIVEAAEKYKIKEILVAIPSANKKELAGILNICKETKCKIKILPGIYQLLNGDISISDLKKVEVQDLLGREPIKVNFEDIMSYVTDKVVMVTGGGGSIGSELCRQVAGNQPKQLIIVDIYENSAYEIQLELKRKYPKLKLEVMIASVRNAKRVEALFKRFHPEIVYHAAAHKHVPLMEDSPNEAVKNNIFGTVNVAKAASKYDCKRFILISTDKAVNPTNIMGATKRICEMIVQSYNKKSKTEFVAVRFGNVLGSNGSVIPLFKKQIRKGGPVTVTHPDITRYFMTIPEAVSLVLQAGAYASGGEIFILDMGKPVKIVDMARNLIKLSGYEPDIDIKIEYTGLRPGEKLYEELLMKEEGLQETPNNLIHIGKPIDIDEKDFHEKLKILKEKVYEEVKDVRPLIQELVPTYKFKREISEIKQKVKNY